MKKIILLSVFLTGAAQLTFAQVSIPATAKNAQKAQMGFVENKGQLTDQDGNPVPDVLFKSCGTGPGIYITTSGITYVFGKPSTTSAKTIDEDPASISMDWSKIEMKLLSASIRKENIVTEDALPGYSNFYYAHCPQGILNVQSWHKVTIKNIYPGIDWVLNADNKNGMSHDFIVHPGANPSLVRILYLGMDLNKFDVDEQERLVFASAQGTMYEGRLHVYEQENGQPVQAQFDILLDANRCIHGHENGKEHVSQIWLEYELGNFSHDKTIVIDPPLQWSMPQASTNFDYGYAISAAHDGTGDALVTGASDGTDFPTANAYQGTLSGAEDMIVERLNAAGTRLWSTYYGGSDYEQGKGIASDNSGNCYVTGNTGSTDFPTLTPTQANYGGGVYDVAILKFNTAGVRQWATWYGGLQNDFGTAIASDGSGTIYVTGYTNSSTFPTLTAHQSSKAVSYDAFIIKLNSSCVVQWATFFGGDDDDKGRAITLDAAGANLFITGTTLAGGFPITAGTFQLSNASAYNAEDAFILKMSAAQVVGFATFCGGSDADFGQGIAVDNSNNIYISGYTLSSDFPIVNPGGAAYVDSTIGSIGTHDAFVVKCNSTGTSRLWATYFGGTSPDLGFGIAYDPLAGIYICGNTASTDFPVQMPSDNNFYQSTQGDGGSFNDMFIAWFGTNDSLRWSTYYGDANGNEAYGICVDANSNIFVTGVSSDNIDVSKFGPGFTTGVSDNSFAGEISVYPNPASSTLHIRLNNVNEGLVNVEIMNVQGQLLLTQQKMVTAGDNLVNLDLGNFSKGVYLLRLISADGSSSVVRFVKE